MDSAEEIVSLWLQQKGFFIRHNVPVGYRGKEIDFLAVNIKEGRRVHVEVAVFVGAIEEPTGELINRCIEEAAKRILLTSEYEKWLVLGELHKKDSEDGLKQEFAKHGVNVIFFKDVLKEIQIKGIAKYHTGRFLQLLASQLTPEAKKSLLGEKRRSRQRQLIRRLFSSMWVTRWRLMIIRCLITNHSPPILRFPIHAGAWEM